MNVLIALDSFKGTLSALEACQVVAASLSEMLPEARLRLLPMADGGEGTADALVAACEGEWITVNGVVGPLPTMSMQADFGWLPHGKTAVVEMARASGLPLLTHGERNPMLTTTRGTGQLLAAALRQGANEILLTLGGSATVDGGTGAARAVGWRFLSADGLDVEEGGQGLNRIAHVVPPDNAPLADCCVRALCDVTNPLCGPDGAAAVYGPQKGATPDMVPILDRGLGNLASCIRRDVGKDVLDLPGAGAAGGFGAGAVAFLGATLVPGIHAVADACGLREGVSEADWVITGEGAFDVQSLQGKVVSGVLDVARTTGARVLVVAGRCMLPPETWAREGIDAAFECAARDVPDDLAFAHARRFLADAARRAAKHVARQSH